MRSTKNLIAYFISSLCFLSLTSCELYNEEEPAFSYEIEIINVSDDYLRVEWTNGEEVQVIGEMSPSQGIVATIPKATEGENHTFSTFDSNNDVKFGSSITITPHEGEKILWSSGASDFSIISMGGGDLNSFEQDLSGIWMTTGSTCSATLKLYLNTDKTGSMVTPDCSGNCQDAEYFFDWRASESDITLHFNAAQQCGETSNMNSDETKAYTLTGNSLTYSGYTWSK